MREGACREGATTLQPWILRLIRNNHRPAAWQQGEKGDKNEMDSLVALTEAVMYGKHTHLYGVRAEKEPTSEALQKASFMGADLSGAS